MKSTFALFVLAALALAGNASARTIYVDNRVGNDSWTGATAQPAAKDGPFATIQPAVNLASAGDTIVLARGSGPYPGGVILKTSGRADAPITLEGNDCSVVVSTDVAQGPWTFVDGKWVLDQPRVPAGTKRLNQRAVAIYQGHPIWLRKNPKPSDVCTASVNADGQFCFQFKDNQKPPFVGLTIPMVPANNGLGFMNASFWHINNLNVFGAGNDGFNLHGRSVGNVIKNCAAFFCGDEGISSHDTVEVKVIDSLFAFNTSSVVDINKSVTSYLRVISAYNTAPGFSMAGEGGKHSITDSLSAANAGQESERNLPATTTKTSNLTYLPDESAVLDKIQAWNPRHPKLPLLIKIVASRAKGAVVAASQP